MQQNSDTTYRVYDYDRTDKDGNKRELHIEKTKDVTTVPFEKVELDQEVYEVGNIKVTQLAEERYFGVYKIEVSGEAELTKNDTGNLFTVLEGQGRIKVEDVVYDIKKGDSFILTTQCSDCLLDGDMLLIGSYDR